MATIPLTFLWSLGAGMLGKLGIQDDMRSTSVGSRFQIALQVSILLGLTLELLLRCSPSSLALLLDAWISLPVEAASSLGSF